MKNKKIQEEKEEKDYDIISKTISISLTSKMNESKLNNYMKKEIKYYHNQLNKEILNKNCSKEFDKYKTLNLLDIEDHGVIGIPIKIKTHDNQDIFIKLNLYSDIIDQDIDNTNTPNYFEYTVSNLLYNLVKEKITNNIIKPLNYYNCKKILFLEKIKELLTEKLSINNNLKYTNITNITNIASNIEYNNIILKKAYDMINNKFRTNNMREVKIIGEYKVYQWKVKPYISLLEMEWVNGNPLAIYLQNLIKKNNNKLMYNYFNSLFQVLYTLIVINKTYNKFQHNDIHLRNILIDLTEKNNIKSNIYELWDTKYKIKLKNNGIVKIIDFDKSNFNYLENKRITTYFSKDLYNHLDNNYDILYVIYGYYKFIFIEYFDILDKILDITNSKKINHSILIIKKNIKKDYKSGSEELSDFSNLNKYEIILIIKCLFFFRNIKEKLILNDLYEIIDFFNGNKKLINNEVLKYMDELNNLRNIINKMSNLIDYTVFFDIFLNGKYRNIIMTDYKNSKNKKYTVLNYIDDKINKYNNILKIIDDHTNIIYKYIMKLLEKENNIISLENEIEINKLLVYIKNVYNSLNNKNINKVYKKIRNDNIYIDKYIMTNTFDMFITNDNNKNVNEIFSDKNINKLKIN